MPGRIPEQRKLFVCGVDPDVRVLGYVGHDVIRGGRDGKGFLVDEGILVRVESAEQPLEPVAFRRYQAELLRELVGTRVLEQYA